MGVATTVNDVAFVQSYLLHLVKSQLQGHVRDPAACPLPANMDLRDFESLKCGLELLVQWTRDQAKAIGASGRQARSVQRTQAQVDRIVLRTNLEASGLDDREARQETMWHTLCQSVRVDPRVEASQSRAEVDALSAIIHLLPNHTPQDPLSLPARDLAFACQAALARFFFTLHILPPTRPSVVASLQMVMFTVNELYQRVPVGFVPKCKDPHCQKAGCMGNCLWIPTRECSFKVRGYHHSYECHVCGVGLMVHMSPCHLPGNVVCLYPSMHCNLFLCQ